jgi:hypothetical protein
MHSHSGAMIGQLDARSSVGVHAVVQFLLLSWSVRVPALVARFCHSFVAGCNGRAVQPSSNVATMSALPGQHSMS